MNHTSQTEPASRRIVYQTSLANFKCQFHLKYVLFLEAALLSSLLNNAQVFMKSDVKPPVLGLIGAELYR